MKIALIIEGKTEKVFLPYLRRFLETRVGGTMPRIDPDPYDGPVPKGGKLQREVNRLLTGKSAADAVIALTDVYTGKTGFEDAPDARRKMREWVGDEPRFYPHAAQFEFEAWLLPYWAYMQQLAGHNKSVPGAKPEQVNHQQPPSHHLKEIFRLGRRREYVKVREADRILRENDLSVAVEACSELRLLVNTILRLCGSIPL